MRRVQAFVYCFLFCSLTFEGILGDHGSSEEEELSEYDVKLANFTKEIIEKFSTHIPKGIPDIGVPSLDPIFVTNTEGVIESSNHFKLLLLLRDMNITGMSKLQTGQWLEVRLHKDVINFHLYVPDLTVQGHCYMTGKINQIIPTKGDGPFSIRVPEVNIRGSGELDFPTGSGGTRLHMKNLELNINHHGETETDFSFLTDRNFVYLWKVEKSETNVLGREVFDRLRTEVMTKLSEALLKFVNNELPKRTLSELLD